MRQPAGEGNTDGLWGTGREKGTVPVHEANALGLERDYGIVRTPPKNQKGPLDGVTAGQFGFGTEMCGNQSRSGQFNAIG